MLVVHGFWDPQRHLCLWAEDSELPVTSKSQALRSARPHPFAASAEKLSELIGVPAAPAQAVLQLPSTAKSPLDSPEVVRVTPRRALQRDPHLLQWTVPVLSVDTPAALAWLTASSSGTSYREGESLHYLQEVAEWAVDLAQNGRVIPGIERQGQEWRALWRPHLHGREALHAHALISAMPPVCRAQPDLEDPERLFFDAVQTLTDVAVRDQLGDKSLVPPRRGRRPKQLPAAELWLAALTSQDPWITAAPEELTDLQQKLSAWEYPNRGQVTPAQATFRLSEVLPEVEQGEGLESAEGTADPSQEHSSWRVDFLLQSTADASLLVPAEHVWADDGSLNRWLRAPQEILLQELGRASSIYPHIAQGLRNARPVGLDLDTAGAYDFLEHAAPKLAEAGFGVLLPSWWDQRKKLGLKLSVSTPTDTAVDKDPAFGRDQLCEFQWRLAVGEEELTEEELAALAEAKAPLVRLRGQWVHADPQQLQRGLEFLKSQGSGRKSLGEVLTLAAAHPEDLDTPMDVTAMEAEGWLGAFLQGRAAEAITPVDQPAGLQAQLRPYQQRGLSWLVFLSSLGLGACLADDMGLGKTIQLLSLELNDRESRPKSGPTLLLCPMSLVGNWQREAARFAPHLRVQAHHGSDRPRGEELAEQLESTDLLVTTYGTALRDIEDLADIQWSRVVLDEAQAIKNSQSRTAKAVRRLKAEHRVALTGTPVENRLSELWSIMEFLNPGMLGSQELFRTRYGIPVERYGDDDAARRLRAITRPYVLRRLKTDSSIIDDLPEKIETKQYCRLTAEQATLYQSVVSDMMQKIEDSTGIERRGNVLAAMAKLKQVCNHPAQLLHDRSPLGERSGKIQRLEEMLEEILAEGDRVLCFTQYTEFAQMLLPHLATRFNTDVAYLHGGTPKARRDEMVAEFQSGEGPPVFLLSLKAGGTGLNLTAANHVIHLDRWWNPAVENQATDRAFRIGQKRSVQVHKLICTGTLEEKIDDMIEQKKALANMVVSDGEGWLTELSTADLRDLFTLSEGAIGE